MKSLVLLVIKSCKVIVLSNLPVAPGGQLSSCRNKWSKEKTHKKLNISKFFLSFSAPLYVKQLLVFMLLPLWSLAQQPDTTEHTINRYLRQAAQNNPELKAQYRRYLASLEQVPQVNTLPDPELSFAFFISPIETRVGPQQARIELQQMFPWFGTLGARGDAASQKAKAKFEAFQEARNKLFFKVTERRHQLYQIDQSIMIMQDNIDILETFESLATQRYETGDVGQIDVLRVQIEKEDLKTQLELLKDNLSVTIQEFNELLNRPKNGHVVIPDSLSAGQLDLSIPELEQVVLLQNPTLTGLDYEALSAQSSVKAARKEGLPSLGVKLDYVVTGKREVELSDNGQDGILAWAKIQIPLFREKYRAKEQQAQLELRSVQDRQEAMENRLQTQLKQALRDYHDAQRRVTLYKKIQIQRTHQALEILTEQYATSATDFEELLRLQRKLLEFELAREKALVDQHTAVAHIEYLYGKYNVNPEEIEFQQ